MLGSVGNEVLGDTLNDGVFLTFRVAFISKLDDTVSVLRVQVGIGGILHQSEEVRCIEGHHPSASAFDAPTSPRRSQTSP